MPAPNYIEFAWAKLGPFAVWSLKSAKFIDHAINF
jgi:hypothetical protein